MRFGVISVPDILDVVLEVISSAIEWFTQAFNGLSAVFIDNTTGTPTLVGVLLLISIGLPIVTYALKFILSLFKGIKR